MDTKTVGIIIAIVAAALQYGPTVVQSAIAALNKDEITLEDILSLKIDKEPEEF